MGRRRRHSGSKAPIVASVILIAFLSVVIGMVYTSSQQNTTQYSISTVTRTDVTTITSCGPNGCSTITSTTTLTGPMRAIRIRPLDTQYMRCVNACWVLPGYTAQDVLNWISELQPTVLERFTSNSIDPNYEVPVCSTCQPMTTTQFLTQAEAACNCPIWPRLSLPANSSKLGDFYSDAQELLNAGVVPNFQVLAIDLWATNYNAYTKAQIITMFQTLEAQGWKGFAVNDCGGYKNSFGYAAYADVCLDTSTYDTPNAQALSSIQKAGETPMLYIDFPGVICKFITNQSPQQQFHDWKVLAKNQASSGYDLVYMLVQPLPTNTCQASNGMYDSNLITYGGQTQFQLFQSLVQSYN